MVYKNSFSDEVGCTVYEKDKSYIKNMPPDTKTTKYATIVELELDILAILEIAEVASYLSMQFEIHLTWLVI